MKALLISAHRRGRLIDIWIRTDTNMKKQITVGDFQPYFYIESDFGEYKGIYGESLTKIFVDDPSQVRKERENYKQTWEADILFTKRFLIDREIYKGIEFPDNRQYVSQNDIKPCEVSIEPLILFLDIEVLQGEGFPTPEEAKQPVISFSFRTGRNNKYFTYILQEGESKVEHENNNIIAYIESEKDLLMAFCAVIEKIQPDVITGWNIIDFDFTYLKNRFKKLDLQWIEDRSFELFDMLAGYKKIFSQPSYALKRVAELEGIAKKEDIETFKEVVGYYQTDIERFANYNRKDVEYIYEIDKKHSLIEYYLELKYLVGLESIENTLISSVLIDTMLLRIARKREIVLPTKPEYSEKVKYEGAYVMAGDAGLYRDTSVYDFSGYYPNIILNFNITPEKIDGEGIIPELVRGMLQKKNDVTEQMRDVDAGSQEYKSLYLKRQAVKGIVNAVYGVMAFPKFRLHKPELASKVAELAREGIKYIVLQAEERGYKVLLADTDSIFIQIPFDSAEDFGYTLESDVHDYFREKYGVKTSLNLEFEKYLKYLLLTGVKKRYAMRIIYNNGKCDYVDVKGFESIRTDQSMFTRSLLDDLFNLILYEKGKDDIKKFIQDKLIEFPQSPLSEIGISRGINKKFLDYKANTPHVRGAIYSNTYLGTNFSHGDKVMMIWCKGVQNLPATNVICFNEDTDLSKYNIIVDYERMKKVCILGKVEPILDAVEIGLSESLSRQGTL